MIRAPTRSDVNTRLPLFIALLYVPYLVIAKKMSRYSLSSSRTVVTRLRLTSLGRFIYVVLFYLLMNSLCTIYD